MQAIFSVLITALLVHINNAYLMSPSPRLCRHSELFDESPLSTTTTASVANEAAPVEWIGAKKLSMKDRNTKTILTVEQISKILPHRYPFLLVDRVVEFEAGKRAVGIKCVTANEPHFTGHFPDRPIMPGVLMIEAMAQLGGIICLQPPISDGKGLFFFAGVTGVRWKSTVVPGDDLVMEMSLVGFDERLGLARMTGKAYVGQRVCSFIIQYVTETKT